MSVSADRSKCECVAGCANVFDSLLNICRMILVLAVLLPTVGAGRASADELQIGQVYGCYSINSYTPVIAQIGAIDQLSSGMLAYSVQLFPMSADFPTINHAPYTASAFANCELLSAEDQPEYFSFDRAGFDDGQKAWKEAKGGVFTMPIEDIYGFEVQTVEGVDQ